MTAPVRRQPTDRPIVVQHSFGDPGSGGPIGALQRVLDSDLSLRYEFVRMHQERATGGIDVARIKQWVRLLRDVRPDLVHVRGLGNEGFHGALAARLAGCPRILVSVHGTVRDLKGPRSVRQQVIVRGLEPMTLRMATHVTTVCNYAHRRDFVIRHTRKLVGPLVNGVELTVAPRRGEARQGGRLELGLTPDQVAIISVGRLTNDKGHADLAAALKRLHAGLRERTALVLVGDGPDRSEIVGAYESSGVQLHALGRRLDVPRLLAAADIFAFPSWHENLSNALLEAMGSGLPVVASRVGGNTEVVQLGGGLLVEPHDPPAFAHALSDLIADDERRVALGTEASEVAAEHYSVERMCEVLDHTYRRIMTEGR